MRAVLTRLSKIGVVIFMCAFMPFQCFGLFAAGGAGQAPRPQPELGRTVFVRVCGGRGSCIEGYVKPWIAHAYSWMFQALEIAVCVAALACAPLLIWKLT